MPGTAEPTFELELDWRLPNPDPEPDELELDTRGVPALGRFPGVARPFCCACTCNSSCACDLEESFFFFFCLRASDDPDSASELEGESEDELLLDLENERTLASAGSFSRLFFSLAAAASERFLSLPLSFPETRPI